MSLLRPGFSERVFEFAFNAEYAKRNLAVLAGAPHIPTQNEEKWLGYDVAFEIKQRGGAVHALALQHKVSRFIDNPSPTNGHFWDKAVGPYFAFRLDNSQYNLLQDFASCGLPGVEVYFCAPLFADRKSMDARYLAGTVERSSLWIDISNTGQLSDDETHSIIYSVNGRNAFLFSEEPVPLNVVDYDRRAVNRAQREGAVLENASEIYNGAFRVLRRQWSRLRRSNAAAADTEYRIPTEFPKREKPTFANTGKLLGQYFGISLLVEVVK